MTTPSDRPAVQANWTFLQAALSWAHGVLSDYCASKPDSWRSAAVRRVLGTSLQRDDLDDGVLLLALLQLANSKRATDSDADDADDNVELSDEQAWSLVLRRLQALVPFALPDALASSVQAWLADRRSGGATSADQFERTLCDVLGLLIIAVELTIDFEPSLSYLLVPVNAELLQSSSQADEADRAHRAFAWLLFPYASSSCPSDASLYIHLVESSPVAALWSDCFSAAHHFRLHLPSDTAMHHVTSSSSSSFTLDAAAEPLVSSPSNQLTSQQSFNQLTSQQSFNQLTSQQSFNQLTSQQSLNQSSSSQQLTEQSTDHLLAEANDARHEGVVEEWPVRWFIEEMGEAPPPPLSSGWPLTTVPPEPAPPPPLLDFLDPLSMVRMAAPRRHGQSVQPPPEPAPPPPVDFGALLCRMARYEVTAARVDVVPLVRVWFGARALDELCGVAGTYKTFVLTAELTAGQLRDQVVRSLLKGQTPEQAQLISEALQSSGATICVQPIYGGEASVWRLRRAENVMSVIARMRQTENQIRTLRSVSKKSTKQMTRRLQQRLQRGSGVITDKKSEQTHMGFLATQAQRIVVTVHQAECLVRTTDVYCSVMINAQKFATKTVRNSDSPVFDEEFVFGVNAATAEQVMQLKLIDARAAGIVSPLLGELEISLESLVALAPSGEHAADIMHVLPLTAAAGTLVTGNVRISVLYCDAHTSSTRFKLTAQQMQEFCRIQPSRLFVSVLHVDDLHLPPVRKQKPVHRHLAVSAKYFHQVHTVPCASPTFATDRMQIGLPAAFAFDERRPLQILLLQRRSKKLLRSSAPSSSLSDASSAVQSSVSSSSQSSSSSSSQSSLKTTAYRGSTDVSAQRAGKKRRASYDVLAAVGIQLTMLRPNTQLIGYFPLSGPNGEPLGKARVKVRLEYLTSGPWTHETAGRLYFRPPPVVRRKFSIRYPYLDMQLHQAMPIRVKVRTVDRLPTDDLGGGELECRVTAPAGDVYYLPAHKDFPGAAAGIFRIDFDPPEPGEYSLVVTHDDREVQKRPVVVNVRPTRF